MTPNLPKSSPALFTDLYQLTMAYGYWKSNIHEQEVVFNLIYRTPPFEAGFVIAAGLATVIEYLTHYHFGKEDIDYLQSLKTASHQPLFEPAFLQYLSKLNFTCTIEAVPEGTAVFPREPLLRIKGPLLQCQLLETVLLNVVNFQTLIATKAARVCAVAQGEEVIEFGLRRAQGFDGGLSASRAAFIGGCAATSNTLAGKLFGIPVRGTHSHSWVMVHATELEAFSIFAEVFPDNCILLVDTYQTLSGIKHAITIGKKLKAHGKKLLGIRLDSGDLAKLSIKARELLDKAGFQETAIFASGDLDEYRIAKIKKKGGLINIWGVGTSLSTSAGHSALDGVYKLGAMRLQNGEWQYKLKLSENPGKISSPGILQVRRYFAKDKAKKDVIYDLDLGIDSEEQDYVDLLQPIFNAGKLIYSIPAIESSQKNTLNSLIQFDNAIIKPKKYAVQNEKKLSILKQKLIAEAQERFEK